LTSPIQHCKDCVDLLGEYIEGTLSPERAKALEEHLSFCPPCITFVRTYRATRKLCRSALAREMPQELMGSLSSFLGKHVPGFPCSKGDTAAAAAPAPADTGPKKV
jgi:anti-sigma factor RsiW